MTDLPFPDENARAFPDVAALRSCRRLRREWCEGKAEAAGAKGEEDESLRPVLFWKPPPPPPMIFPVSGSRATAKAFWPEVAVAASAATEETEEERARAVFWLLFGEVGVEVEVEVERGFVVKQRRRRGPSASLLRRVGCRSLLFLSLSPAPRSRQPALFSLSPYTLFCGFSFVLSVVA